MKHPGIVLLLAGFAFGRPLAQMDRFLWSAFRQGKRFFTLPMTINGREWHTAPLWGLGLLNAVSGETRLLHDGRARSVEEAILWHGGEAQAARDRFVGMSAPERQDLLAFLASL